MRERRLHLHIMLNEEESKALSMLREKSGLSSSALFRKFLLNEHIRERPNADFKKLTDEVNDIGVNFNQLVHVVNTVGYASPEDLKQAQLYFDRIIRKLRSWEKTWR